VAIEIYKKKKKKKKKKKFLKIEALTETSRADSTIAIL